MDFIEELKIERACSKLVLRFNMGIDEMGIDSKAIESMMELFTEDASWYSLNGPLKGHAEIRHHLEEYPKQLMAHVSTNIVVDVIDAEHAEAVSYMVWFGSRQQPFTNVKYVGHMRDDFVKTPSGWKIKDHKTTILFKDPAYTIGADQPAPVTT